MNNILTRRLILSAIIICFISCIFVYCDPLEIIHIVKNNKESIKCKDGLAMTYDVFIKWKNGKKETMSFPTDRRLMRIKNYESASVAIMQGNLESKIDWIQFVIYCGYIKAPFYTTPKLKASDFTLENNEYYYIINAE